MSAHPTTPPQDFLKTLEANLKPLNTPADLVRVGIFRTVKTAANRRSNGTGPEYIKLPGGAIVYPDEAVLEWARGPSTVSSRSYRGDSK